MNTNFSNEYSNIQIIRASPSTEYLKLSLKPINIPKILWTAFCGKRSKGTFEGTAWDTNIENNGHKILTMTLKDLNQILKVEPFSKNMVFIYYENSVGLMTHFEFRMTCPFIKLSFF